jgi:hypothetical protein
VGQNKRLLTAERMRAGTREDVQLPGTAGEPEEQRKLKHPDYQAMMRGRKDKASARRRVRRGTQQKQRHR